MHLLIYFSLLFLASAKEIKPTDADTVSSSSGTTLYYNELRKEQLRKGRKVAIENKPSQEYDTGYSKRVPKSSDFHIHEPDYIHGYDDLYEHNVPHICAPGEVLNIDGTCAVPVVTRNLFFYAAPPPVYVPPHPVKIPVPKVDYDIVFIGTPETPKPLDPLVIPPPKKKTLVYVLNRKKKLVQRVIEIPHSRKENPEVFYVNYKEGDDHLLPGGVQLKDALSSIAHQGKVVKTIKSNDHSFELGPHHSLGSHLPHDFVHHQHHSLGHEIPADAHYGYQLPYESPLDDHSHPKGLHVSHSFKDHF